MLDAETPRWRNESRSPMQPQPARRPVAFASSCRASSVRTSSAFFTAGTRPAGPGSRGVEPADRTGSPSSILEAHTSRAASRRKRNSSPRGRSHRSASPSARPRMVRQPVLENAPPLVCKAPSSPHFSVHCLPRRRLPSITITITVTITSRTPKYSWAVSSTHPTPEIRIRMTTSSRLPRKLSTGRTGSSPRLPTAVPASRQSR
mmetsp:Transcript_11256/g.35707  ORF Transcript_11256/g.35707 Transcript_11256/m.35707 type:complete len:204 (-) Transcript_11256:239-850(-)